MTATLYLSAKTPQDVFGAIVALAQAIGWPKSYQSDLYRDAVWILTNFVDSLLVRKEHDTKTLFWSIRESGTDIGLCRDYVHKNHRSPSSIDRNDHLDITFLIKDSVDQKEADHNCDVLDRVEKIRKEKEALIG